MEGGREDWGPVTMRRRLARHLTSNGEPQEALSEGVIWQKLAMAAYNGKQGAPHPQRDMTKPHWPEDPPLSEPLTGRAVASLYPLPASGGPNHLPPFAMLSSSPPSFPVSRIPSCPVIYSFFFVAKGSLVLDHSERSHYPPM